MGFIPSAQAEHSASYVWADAGERSFIVDQFARANVHTAVMPHQNVYMPGAELIDYKRSFTGVGQTYDALCTACADGNETTSLAETDCLRSLF